MRKLHRHVPVALALLLTSVTSSCGVFKGLFVRSVPIHRGKNKPATAQQTLLEASRDQLVERIAKIYNAINSFQATITMTPSVGSVYKGQINEITDVKAFILFRKPADIRILAQAPVLRTTILDMVSNGSDFRFYLSSKNLFVEGSNSAPATSKNNIENLRPAAFLSSMLIMPPDPSTETPVMTDLTDEDNALYAVLLIRKMPDGNLRATRQIWFDRLDLSIVRQMVYDDTGKIASDTRYTNWKIYDGVSFPAHIEIQRPIDGYGVVMDMEQMQMNKALTDDKFVLTQPAGSTLQVLGAANPQGPPK
jgi:outer membrane lipoprotein-sorting protein